MLRYTFAALFVAGVAFSAEPPKSREGPLSAGSKAPSFQLKDLITGKEVALIDGKKPTVLIFGSCT